ncbi:nuclease-related domain-containing DEAD/DEAH box helicase [Vibrio fluvialis]|uniref:nuclease-related domain-containing DEAD/DEAH box helicase n=1 Tax=Vibrio fluvialis TaxID=676 RepID=UPI00130256E9|nr:NERD domain-containing protein [Vibrio fluvialis]MCG6343931.1 NERD domain-containing protein [Vibrio fluvialis]
MADMIPRIIDADNPSDGEKHLFERLKEDPQTKNWTVLHSLNIAYHKTQVLGEIDFLVIIPEVCVFAIEVKAHRFAKYEKGLWYLGKNSTGSTKGPFKQINDSVFSLVEYLKRKSNSLTNIPIFPFVIFTHTELNSNSIEWHPREFCGVREYRKIPISNLLLSRAASCRKHFSNTLTATWFHSTDHRPSKADIALLVRELRPSVEMTASFDFFRASTRKELITLTKEQFTSLDAMEDNKRVVFNGAAGVGKTLLAIEAARRAVKRGYKLLFLCKNNLLAKKIRTELVDLEVYTITELLEKYANSEFVNQSNRNLDGYWETNLPNAVFEEILLKEECPYNYLVIDEAQDILSIQNWLDCLDLLLEGGISNGRWSLFGDFELQNIYSVFKKNTILDDLRIRCSDFPIFRLAVNCRNLKVVSELSFSLAEIDIPYSKYLRTAKPISDSKYYFYSSDEQQIKTIMKITKGLLAQGFKASDVVLLSRVAESKSVSHKYQNELGVLPFNFKKDVIQFTSIHKYKGLESPVVILTDFKDIESEASKKMLYVGASRATELVIYMFNDKVRTYLIKGIKEK